MPYVVERVYGDRMGQRRRQVDPVRLAVAQVTGTSERYAAGRISEPDALAEIEESLLPVRADRRDALDRSAAAYVGSEHQAWAGRALQLLAAAGADLVRAEALHAMNTGAPPGMLADLAEQASEGEPRRHR